MWILPTRLLNRRWYIFAIFGLFVSLYFCTYLLKISNTEGISEIRRYVRSQGISIIRSNYICYISGKPPVLLIIVHSDIGNFYRRNLIRLLWASYLSPEVKVAFMVGTSDNDTLQNRIQSESFLNNDMIQEDIVESFRNRTYKSLLMLKWVQLNCQNVKYLLKTNDDYFVNVRRLLHILKDKTEGNSLLMGFLMVSNYKLRPSNGCEWYALEFIIYCASRRLHYLSESAYIMSIDVVHKLYDASYNTPIRNFSEGIYITGICAEKAGITPINWSKEEYL